MINKNLTLTLAIMIFFSIPWLILSEPSLQFTNGTSTGLSSPTDDTLFFGIDGEERVNIDSTDMFISATLVASAPLCLTHVFCRQSVQIHPANVNKSSVTVSSGISVLFINDTASISRTVNVTLPSNPIDGQLLTIMSNKNSSNRYITLNYTAGAGGATTPPSTRISPRLTPTGTLYGASITYIYVAAKNTWYKFRRG